MASEKVTEKMSSTSVKTVASAQPSEGSVHLAGSPKHDDGSTGTCRPPISAATRFTVTLLVLVSQGVVVVLTQRMLVSNSSFYRQLASVFTLFAAFFTSEWIRIHSFALTRQKRAFFDEVNILETYQPRARLMGHLFQPDPPTPGPVVKISDDPNQPERSDTEKAAFNANRDAHYKNMFEYAMRVAKESEEADKQAVDAQKQRLASESATGKKPAKSGSESSTATAIPKGEPLYDEVSNTASTPATVSTAASPGTPATSGSTNTASLPLLENVDGGVRLELPASLREKVDEKSIRASGSSPNPPDQSDNTLEESSDKKPGDASKTTEPSSVSEKKTETNTASASGPGTATDTVKSGKKRRKKRLNKQ